MISQTQFFVGIDVSDRTSVLVVLNAVGEKVRQRQISNRARSLQTEFSNRAPMRIALEVGAQSMWMARTLRSFGHEVYVANPRELRLISGSTQKSDANDALLLARLIRVDPELLRRSVTVRRTRNSSCFSFELGEPCWTRERSW